MCGPTVLAPGQTTQTLQTLVPVTNINQAVFIDGDKAIVRERWSKVFVSEFVSENLFYAIAKKRGASSSGNNQVSKGIYSFQG